MKKCLLYLLVGFTVSCADPEDETKSETNNQTGNETNNQTGNETNNQTGNETNNQTTCSSETWDDDGDPSTPCVPKTTCLMGEYITQPGDSLTDRECSPCPDYQIGTSENATRCLPEPFVEIRAGNVSTCGRYSDGKTLCWGINTNGLAEPPATLFSALSNGVRSACGIDPMGQVQCWGADPAGFEPDPSLRFRTVSLGTNHACGITTSDQARCWGSDTLGQTNVPDDMPFSALIASNGFSCGLRSDTQTAICWGANTSGQALPPATEFSAIALGAQHGCGIRASDRTIECWGDNRANQLEAPSGAFLGLDSFLLHTCGIRDADKELTCWGSGHEGRPLPTPPQGVSFRDISVGASHGCGLREDTGQIECWHDGMFTLPASSPSTQPIIDVSAAESSFCMVQADGEPRCVGISERDLSPPSGQDFRSISLGTLGACGIDSSTGNPVCWGGQYAQPPVLNAVQLSSGNGFHCAIDAQEEVTCWGINVEGQLNVPDGLKAHQISSYNEYSCAIRTGARDTVCWGRRDYTNATPMDHISVGNSVVCGVHSADTIECWGSPTIADQAIIDAAIPSRNVSLGTRHACGIGAADGKAKCWGDDRRRQLTAPEDVFQKVVAGNDFTCGIRLDDTATCWGALVYNPR